MTTIPRHNVVIMGSLSYYVIVDFKIPLKTPPGVVLFVIIL